MRTPNYAQQLATLQREIDADSRDFMKYGRALILIREAAEAEGQTLGTLISNAGVPRRKVYAVINAVDTADALGLTDETASSVGWSKLAVIGPHLTGDRSVDDVLVHKAITCNQATLRAHVTKHAGQPLQVVQVALTKNQRRRFDKALLGLCNGMLPANPAERGKMILTALERHEARPNSPTLIRKRARKTHET